jgi:mono/diheme cytochrome c family protein
MKKQVFIIPALIIGSFILFSMTSLKNTVQEPWEVPAKYQKLENPFVSDADAENIGRELYSKHCKSCHGTKGKGDGPKAEGLDTPIGDFTSSDFKNQTDGSLYYKTVFGRDDMPSFEKKIPDEQDRWLIVNYLKNL